MHPGHRRTQSANLIMNPCNLNTYSLIEEQDHSSILTILSRCSDITKEKVCRIEQINVTIDPQQKESLFQFGKKRMKNTMDNSQFNSYMDGLISIPEKINFPLVKLKTTLHTECSPKQTNKDHYQSSIRLSKQVRRSKVPFKEISNKNIKEKQRRIGSPKIKTGLEAKWIMK